MWSRRDRAAEEAVEPVHSGGLAGCKVADAGLDAAVELGQRGAALLRGEVAEDVDDAGGGGHVAPRGGQAARACVGCQGVSGTAFRHTGCSVLIT